MHKLMHTSGEERVVPRSAILAAWASRLIALGDNKARYGLSALDGQGVRCYTAIGALCEVMAEAGFMGSMDRPDGERGYQFHPDHGYWWRYPNHFSHLFRRPLRSQISFNHGGRTYHGLFSMERLNADGVGLDEFAIIIREQIAPLFLWFDWAWTAPFDRGPGPAFESWKVSELARLYRSTD